MMKTIEQKAARYDEAIEIARNLHKDAIAMEDTFRAKQCVIIFPELEEDEDVRIMKEIAEFIYNAAFKPKDIKKKEKWLTWLEKQGTEIKQLYIRFGDIPANEKSKIYCVEEEIGDENGVSVYPAFELNGNVVLGLTLPITRTTLYTQQNLFEYDDRPCYLVSGDYVGKGTDGELLIRNVSIIKRLDNYRIKEFEKQGEQKHTDKIEPKFKVGDWVIFNGLIVHIDEVEEGGYKTTSLAVINSSYDWEIDKIARRWTIQDAKDGDVLVTNSNIIFIFKYLDEGGTIAFRVSCAKNSGAYFPKLKERLCDQDVYPATKEQRDLLFQKIKEAGYDWDAEKKELKKIEQKPTIEMITPEESLGIDSETYNKIVDECLFGEQASAWSEEDENMLNSIIATCELAEQDRDSSPARHLFEMQSNWLKSLKDRMKGE